MVDADSRCDATYDDGHAPPQEVEPQHGFGRQGHVHGLWGWGRGLVSLGKLLQHVAVIEEDKLINHEEIAAIVLKQF